jgi:transposase
MKGKRRKLEVKLTRGEKRALDRLLTKGRNSARIMRRANILRLLGSGRSPVEISDILGCTPETARRLGWKYLERGFEVAVFEHQRYRPDRLLSSKQSAQIVAMVCSDPPEGFQRWSVRLIAEYCIKRKIVPKVGRETIRLVLSNHELKPWREKNVVRGNNKPRIQAPHDEAAQGVQSAV